MVKDSKVPEASLDSKSRGGYDASFFDELVRFEDRHFWFQSRNFLIQELAKKISSELNPELVLEVGCGTGNVLRVLRETFRHSTVVGLELWFDGLRHARSRTSGPLVQGDVRNFPFAKQFDLVCMFDVLEHIPQDREILRALYEAIRPGGKVLMTVPAHQFLWSYFDEAARHCRRYSPSELRTKLLEAGFEIEFLSQFMAFTFPMLWAYRKLRGARQQGSDPKQVISEDFRPVPLANGILTAILNMEVRWLARYHTLPLGTSLVVIGRKS